MKRNGFTLVELLIVVAIIGIIAAIAIPNLLNAIDRGKQKRTMADTRSIGTALESYAVDINIYPTHAAGNLDPATAMIEPVYIKSCPRNDAWKSPFNLVSTAASYTLRSPGKGGVLEAIPANPVSSTLFTADIIFMNGQFWQWPEGQQK